MVKKRERLGRERGGDLVLPRFFSTSAPHYSTPSRSLEQASTTENPTFLNSAVLSCGTVY